MNTTLQEDGELSGRVYMVTGAGSGIGAATAELLGRHGATVVLTGRRMEMLQATAARMSSRTPAACHALDVADEEGAAALVEEILAAHGRLDGAFNSAGIFGVFGPLEHDTAENFQQVVSTNLRGVWACMKAQIPAIRKSGGGSVVNCSSVAGHQGHAKSPIYSATKHAVIGLSKSAALQYGPQGVRVNVLSPGSTDTPILRALYQDEAEFRARAARAPLGRVGEPAEVAEAAMWLLSERSSYVNGHTLIVDGGVLAGSASVSSASEK